MHIRNTIPADAEPLAALIDSVTRERLYLSATVGFSVEATRAHIVAIQDSEGVHVVAEHADILVGWCDIMPHPWEGMRHVGRLGMGVHRHHRGKGIGERLIRAALESAFERGLARVELEVFATNKAAIALYEKVGFELEGRKVAARKLDGITDDILIYAARRRAQPSRRAKREQRPCRD